MTTTTARIDKFRLQLKVERLELRTKLEQVELRIAAIEALDKLPIAARAHFTDGLAEMYEELLPDDEGGT